MKKIKIFYILLSFTCTNIASASIIYDTGSGSLNGSGATVFNLQLIASKFTVTEETVIDSIEFWLMGSKDKTAQISLYADDGFYNSPALTVPGTELYTSPLVTSHVTYSLAEWKGVSALNWHVSPGVYWATFEVREGQTFLGKASGFYKEGDVDEFGNSVDDGRNNPATSDNFAVKTIGSHPTFDGIWRTYYNANMAFGTLIKSVDVNAPPIMAIWIISSILIFRRKKNTAFEDKI